MADAMARFVGRRSDGTIIVSVGDPIAGPHWQGDWPLSMEEAVLWHAAPDLVEALEECRATLAMMVDPAAIAASNVQHAAAKCIAAEAKARAALARASAGGAG